MAAVAERVARAAYTSLRPLGLRVRRYLGSRSARLECEFARLREGNTTTTILGPPLRLSHAPSFEGMYRDIFEREIYRFESSIPAPRIIDCGANIGLASLYLAQQHPHARITAFEADPAIADIARSNMASFGLSKVEIVTAAITDHDGDVAFAATGDLAGRIADASEPVSGHQRVPCVRLGRYLQEPVEFLKIDIEGSEIAALSCVKDELRNVRLLFVEYHGFASRQQDLPEFLQLLSAAGFRYYITSAYDFRRSPLCDTRVHLGMDVQLNIFCTRIEPSNDR